MTTVTALLLVLALLAGMSLMLEVGLHVGRRHIEEEKGAFNEGFGAVENAVFALLGLLLAFTFSGAAERYDARRNLIVQEANAVGTVLLRFDLLPDDARRELRELLASYVSARNAAYEARNEQSVAGLKESVYQGLQKDIWTRTLAALESDAPNATRSLVISALNEMIDLTTLRTMALKMHPPMVIYGVLFFLSLIAALISGYSMAASPSRKWFRIFFSVGDGAGDLCHTGSRIHAGGLDQDRKFQGSAGRSSAAGRLSGLDGRTLGSDAFSPYELFRP